MIHCGVLAVADCFSAARIARLLPPEHQIAAIKRRVDDRVADYLIEGPSLPLSDPLTPPTICVLFTMRQIDGGRVRLTGEWAECAAALEWTVGDWASVDEYWATSRSTSSVGSSTETST